MRQAEVLSEGIVWKQDPILFQEGEHAVRPMQHRSFHENQLFAITDIQGVAGVYNVEIPLWMMVMTVDRVHAIGGAIDRRIRDQRHQFCQRPCMVLFGMIDDDIVQRVQVDFHRQVLYELPAEPVINRINQHGLFFTDQVAIVTATFVAFVFCAMKVPHLPIALTDSMDVVLDEN